MLVAVVATVEVSLIHLLSQLSVRRVGQEWNEAWLVECEGESVVILLILCCVAYALRKVAHLACIELQYEAVVLGEEVVVETNGEQRQFLVDLSQASLLLLVEECTLTSCVLVHLLHETNLLGIQLCLVALVVYHFDALEELIVHRDCIVVGSQERHHLLLYGHHLVVVHRCAHHSEDVRNRCEHHARTVELENCILECRLLLVGQDKLNLAIVECHSLLESGLVVLGLDAVEWWYTVRSLPLCEQRIAGIASLLRAKCGIK